MHTLVVRIIAYIQEYQSSGLDKITDFQGKQIIYTEKLVVKKTFKNNTSLQLALRQT